MGHRVTRRAFAGGLGACALACGEALRPDAGTPAFHEPPRPPDLELHPAIGPLEGLSETERGLYFDPHAFTQLGEPPNNGWRRRVTEPDQTFADYLVSAPRRPDDMRRRLYLLPLGTFPAEFVVEREYVVLVRSPPLRWLADYVERFFDLPVVVLDADELDALDVSSRDFKGHQQFDARALLDALADRLPDDAYSMTALVNRDLFVRPDQEYAFGFGLHHGRRAVMSFAHFDPMFMGHARPDSWRRDIDRRSLAILSHEIAHTFGLQHCTFYRCLLNGVAHPEELDATPLHLCPVCLHKLQWITGIDPVRRYEGLHGFYALAGLDREAQWVDARLRRVQGLVRAAGP
jgi:archaemetzincin